MPKPIDSLNYTIVQHADSLWVQGGGIWGCGFDKDGFYTIDKMSTDGGDVVEWKNRRYLPHDPIIIVLPDNWEVKRSIRRQTKDERTPHAKETGDLGEIITIEECITDAENNMVYVHARSTYVEGRFLLELEDFNHDYVGDPYKESWIRLRSSVPYIPPNEIKKVMREFRHFNDMMMQCDINDRRYQRRIFSEAAWLEEKFDSLEEDWAVHREAPIFRNFILLCKACFVDCKTAIDDE